MAGLLQRALKEEGHAVDVAADGPQGMDGFQLCRRLRESGAWAPVLMLTARDGVTDRVRGLDAGADDYLVKPFSLLELAARLRALARRDGRGRPPVLAEGDLRLDPASKQAWRAGIELHLSPKEYVNYLRRKIDAPFGRRDLETVRGMGYRLRRAGSG